MRILLLCNSFNSLTQRLHVELRELGHNVSVEFDINDAVTRDAVELFKPHLLIAPFLKRAIPEDVWRSVLCWIVHPGIRGDRGPAALDWAILNQATSWGVTLVEARGEMDAGPVWAWREFPLRTASKSSLYRNEITEGAVACVLEALDRLTRAGRHAYLAVHNEGRGVARPDCGGNFRRVDFAEQDTATVLRIIRAADGMPGARGLLFGRDLRLFDAHEAVGLQGPPGTPLATSGPAIAVATRNSAVWIGHVKEPIPRSLKLPATHLLGDHIASLPEIAGYPSIRYEEEERVGFLHFPFYNGAMSTQDCHALLTAFRAAISRPTRVLVLMAGADYWSNGLNLALIEGASSPADESWANINAIDDFVAAIIGADDRLVIAAVRGNAGAGGVFVALACDEIWMREGVILNPHYKDMGNLFGSEYWTYLLPRRVGTSNARRLTQARLPMGIVEAERLGLVDRRLPSRREDAEHALRTQAGILAEDPSFNRRITEKRRQRASDEADKPLASYRAEELQNMRINFWGFDPSYHVARFNFIRKVPKSRTPLTLAQHRSPLAQQAALSSIAGRNWP